MFFAGFGESAFDFEIRAFVDSLDKQRRVRREIHVVVERALREAGIEIPFPKHDRQIRSAKGVSGFTAAAPIPKPSA